MKTSLARIFVQNPFCTDCITPIKKRIMNVQNIRNVALYPSDSLVVFNFNKVNQVSEVLNTLMALGHPQKGDHITDETFVPPLCKCKVHSSNTSMQHQTILT
ncbi:MAG: hypothetical protein QNJ57_05665 [Flavobacteriaceae bacterium]|nr:hypothetical protein [Flavobacteriaceae bacterium]